jgi:hypothetical protein
MTWGRFKIEVDDERPGDYEATAEYRDYVLRAHVKVAKGRPIVVGLGAARPSSSDWARSVRPRGVPKALSLRDFRRLPMATFAAKARDAVAQIIRHQAGEFVSLADFNAAVEQAKPDRRGKAARDWARIAKAYQDAVARGEQYPSATVAKRMGVDPGQMRVWVYRLRKAGILEPVSHE